MFISFKPFLQGLQTPDFTQFTSSLFRAIEFETQLAPRPPAYTTTPGFMWDLSPLLSDHSAKLSMVVQREKSITDANKIVKSGSTLDPSQVDAILSALTRELCLVQGPPGTGKTYTGVQLLRLFVANGLGPIVVMAQTNHALDNILRSAYDKGVTKEIVRLGRGSNDNIMMGLTLMELEAKRGRTGGFGKIYAAMEVLEKASPLCIWSWLGSELTCFRRWVQ